MSLIVVKFGGTSVGNVDRIKNAASKVAQEIRRGNKVAVVVSAMAGVTDQLLDYCHNVAPHPNRREVDAVVATGEQVNAGLMALALEQRGINARSWHGWQVAIKTDSNHTRARILNIDTEAMRKQLDKGEVAVVAGFQGVTEDGRITTLGRGGSDTSAVALAAALKADRCDIYTDVDGVYTADPRIVTKAKKLSIISYEEMLELAGLGAKVLQTRSVEMSLRYRMPIQVLSTFENQVGSELPGTLVTNEDLTMENNPVTGIAHSIADARLTIVDVSDVPGVAASIFTALSNAGINVGVIAQTASSDGKTTDINCTVGRVDMERAIAALESEKENIGFKNLLADKNIAKISLVGLGMRTRPGIAAMMFQTLADKGINIQLIETSEINISVLIADEYLELALRALHTAFGLDDESKGQERNAS
ncbi:MAG: aspartate kinase [Proteobacteria bacterium]|jgi:aspartate kinase|nr:aspartate kinase [Alphaproteobacteria bacterium]NCC03950.1 aspartate kinase [Pseudomonadota bacterium]